MDHWTRRVEKEKQEKERNQEKEINQEKQEKERNQEKQEKERKAKEEIKFRVSRGRDLTPEAIDERVFSICIIFL